MTGLDPLGLGLVVASLGLGVISFVVLGIFRFIRFRLPRRVSVMNNHHFTVAQVMSSLLTVMAVVAILGFYLIYINWPL